MRRPTRLEVVFVVCASLLFLGSTYFTRSYREARRELSLFSTEVVAKEAEAQLARQALQSIGPLRVQLAELETELASSPDIPFPRGVDNVALVEFVASTARQNDVRILGIQSQGMVEVQLAGQNYMTHRYELRSQGGLPQLGRFISAIEAGAFRTIAVEAGSLSAAQNVWDMTLYIALFTRKESA